MFPISEFNFVVAGIATFAATVGYACSRRLSTTLSEPNAAILRQTLKNGESLSAEKTSTPISTNDILIDEEPTPAYAPLNSETEAESRSPAATTSILVRHESLKRKIPHDGFDEPSKEELGYPHNLANIYPNKRSRTPTSESESTSQNVTPAASLDSIISQTTDVDVDIPLISDDPQPLVNTPAPEPPRTPSPALEQASPREPSPTPVPMPASPPPLAASTPQPESPLAATPPAETPVPPTTPKSATPKPSSTPSGFAAFAGSTSPFAAFSKPKSRGPKSSGSIWSSAADLSTAQNEDAEASKAFADIFNPLAAAAALEEKKEVHAIEEAKATSSHPTQKYTHITGEEEENVELEQKGVKLYIKRGDKPFGDGMLGHVKLLSKRTTGEERILFRRDPLWKVSMNVRVQPTVRCTFVPEENVVRLILKENVDTPSTGSSEGETKLEVVIYAIKPGRLCSKKDFKEFAETLVKCPHFKGTITDLPSS